ncbi:hypothetical protein Franean1_0263 [Parafrankia sp. EAN1pec]|nr:hypothetical protein Franean1_0263 [Frankia sp. EAN1pec]
MSPPNGERRPGMGSQSGARVSAASDDRSQRNPRAQVEVTDTDVRVIAKFSPDLRDGLRTLGAHWVPGHWSVPVEHRAEAVEIVADILGAPVVDDLRGGR